MRRMLVVMGVAGLVLLSACSGGTSATPTPNSTSAGPTPTAILPTNPPLSATAGTPQPVQTAPEVTVGPAETLPAETQATTGSPAAVDLCSLLTTAQVAAALNETVLDGSPDVGSCTWVQADASGTATLVVESDSVDDFNSIRTITGGVYDVTTVTGLGDDAYVTVATGTNVVTLYVRKGDDVIQVAVVSDSWTADDETTADKALAAEAIAGL